MCVLPLTLAAALIRGGREVGLLRHYREGHWVGELVRLAQSQVEEPEFKPKSIHPAHVCNLHDSANPSTSCPHLSLS
jgi:hypothetical protein